MQILRGADRIESPRVAAERARMPAHATLTNYMYREYGSWQSPSLGRTMEFLWFGKFGRPVMLFPTSAGRFFENEDFKLTDSLADKVDAGEIQLVLVDTVNNESWYNKRRSSGRPRRAPRAVRRLPAPRAGAVHLQSRAARRSGGVRRELRRVSRRELRRALSGRRQPRHLLLRRLRHPRASSTATGTTTATSTARPPTSRTWTASGWASCRASSWVIATGEHDTLVQKNRDFSSMLWSKGIPNHSRSGAASSATTGRGGGSTCADSSDVMKRIVTSLALLVAVSAFGQARWATAPRDSVIVEFRDAALSKGAYTTLARFRADLTTVSRKAEIRREYTRVFSGVSVRVPRGDLAAIAALPYVKRVHDDHEMRAMGGPAAAQIGATTVWTGYGTRGKGVVVAVIDTGVDYTHEALGKGFGAGFKVAGGYDFANDDADPMDDNGHGTHVSGIIAGDSARITGIAPDATLIAFKVLHSNGSGSESDVIAAIERAADPNNDGDTSDHVDVVNLSLGGPGGPDDPASRAVDNGSKLGIVFCIAAGNAGRNHTVLSPGAARTAITVGAVTTMTSWPASRRAVRRPRAWP